MANWSFVWDGFAPHNFNVKQQENPLLVAYSDFLAYCKTLGGETLHTLARSRPFTVSLEDGVLIFIPSTGIARRANAKKTTEVLRLLAESNEWAPSAYRSITQHASYILAIAKRSIDRASHAV